MLRRIVHLGVLAAAMLVATASPALAHGGGGPDASNYASTVTGVVTAAGDGTPTSTPADLANVSWRVLANDALLQVVNRSGRELVVPGYSGEPYLRVGPDGVWENRNSPAAYLNADRFAQTQVPQSADAEAKPVWVRVSDGPAYAWHDHRIHWMSPALPPQVVASRGAETLVNDWAVPFALGDRAFVVRGNLRWIPPPPWWPWLLGALTLLCLPLLAALRVSSGEPRRRALVRVGAVLLSAMVVIDVVHSVDDIVAVPATVGQNLAAGLQSALFIAIAAYTAVVAWRGGPGAATAAGIGAGVLALGIGFSHLSILSSSQVASLLPDWFSRAIVGANLAVAVPLIAVAVFTSQYDEPAPAETAVEGT